jgi:Flp pilus assembly protein protease CpaA
MIYLYWIVAGLGIVSSYTDIKFRKIKNKHLIFFFIAGVVIHIILLFQSKMILNKAFFLNFLTGLGIGLLSYFWGLWAAGDAKLFIVYVFLMPYSKYSQNLLFPSLALFTNIFLVSFLAVFLFLIIGRVKNKEAFFREGFLLNAVRRFLRSFLIIFSFGWIGGYILNTLGVSLQPLITVVLFYLFFTLIHKILAQLKDKKKVLILLLLGIGLHFLVYPAAFSFENLFSYFIRIGFFTLLFLMVNLAIDKEKQEKFRIPFAPFMFLGAVTLESGLIYWVMNIYRFLPFLVK